MAGIGIGIGSLFGGKKAFAPSNASNLAIWYDASDLTTLFQDSALTTPVAANSDPVGGWKDKSGNAINALQTNSGQRPLYKTGVQNSLPGLLLDAVDDQWLLAPALAAADWTAFFCCKPTSATGVASFLLDAATGRLVLAHLTGSGASNLAAYFDGSWHNAATVETANAQVLEFVLTSAAPNILRDGTSLGTFSGYTQKALGGAVRLGSHNGGAGNFFGGHLFEVLIYNRALTAAERASVRGYLRGKWGTP